MSYYLSYIEINGHASLILSKQSNSSAPTKIITQVGFTNEGLDSGYLGTQAGFVKEEKTVARTMYTDVEVKHRTYEISKEEMEKVLSIINQDRNLNLANPSATSGGPHYQQIKQNCKTYAMNLFKNAGIIDAEILSNFMIQRPNTTDNLLSTLEKSDFSCPAKDNLIKSFEKELTELNQGLKKLIDIPCGLVVCEELPSAQQLANLQTSQYILTDTSLYYFDKQQNKLEEIFVENFNDLKEHFPASKKQLTENDLSTIFLFSGYKRPEEKDKAYLELKDQVTSLIKHNNNLIKCKNKIGLQEVGDFIEKSIAPSFKEILELKPVEMAPYKPILESLYKKNTELIQLNNQNNLEYYWTNRPETTARVYLNNFNDQEKAIYITKIKFNEAIDGLNLAQAEIEKRIKISSDPILCDDLKNLKIFIMQAKNEVIASKSDFESVDPASNIHNIISQCDNYQNRLDKTLAQLDKNVSTFDYKSKETNPVVKFVNKILTFLKKDYITIENAQDVVKEKSSSILNKFKQYKQEINNLNQKKPTQLEIAQLDSSDNSNQYKNN